MNHVSFSGRLTADPEMRQTKNNVPFCVFRLAVARESDYKATDFFPCIAWRETAELCGKYLYKGRQCLVQGEMQVNSYTARDGSQRSEPRLLVRRIEFFGKSNAAQDAPVPTDADAPDMGGFMQVDEDGLPF